MRQSMRDWVACSSPIWSKPGSLATPTLWQARRQPMNPKITEQHRSRPAYIYVRQSTNAQVLHHQESTERQYALREMALELGWSESTIRTLDRDLGMTGTEMTKREDFKTLVADVSMSQVGAVFALEVSRLARSNLDWHRLLELFALTATLVIGEDGCYDPSDFNDGLLLGFEGDHGSSRAAFFAPRASSAVSSTKRKKASCASRSRLVIAMTSKTASSRAPRQKCAARWPWCFASFAKRTARMRSSIASRKADYAFPSELTA